MKKNMFLIVVLMFLISSPPTSTFAYTGGLLNGEPINIGNYVGEVNTTTAKLTDGDEATYESIYSQSTTSTWAKGHFAWYEFITPTELEAYQWQSSNLTFTILFLDGSKNIIYSKTNHISSEAGVKQTLITPVSNVKYVAIRNDQTNSGAVNVSEFDVFSAPPDTTPPTEVTNLTTTPGNSQVQVDFNLPSDTDFSHTNIYFSSDEGATYTQWTEASNTDTTALITGLTNGISYTIKVTTSDTSSNESTGVTITATPVDETEVVISAGVVPGPLSIGTINLTGFPNLLLDGTRQSMKSTLNSFQVSDATGIGAGWHVMVEASQFTEVGGLGLTLPFNSLTLDAPTSITGVDTTSPLPTITPGAPWSIDSGTPVTILSASVNEGMGKYDVNFGLNNLTLTIPADVKVVDSVNYTTGPTPYESTITFTIISGP